MLEWKMLTVSSQLPLLRGGWGGQVGMLAETLGNELRTLYSTNALVEERGSVSILTTLDMGKLRQQANGTARA